MNSSDIVQLQLEQDIVIIQSTTITQVVSYSMSLNRKKIIINTKKGFVLVEDYHTLKRFENKNSPFWVSQIINNGAKASAVSNTRNEVALIPFQSKRFSEKSVYIYDYKLKSILYNTSFHHQINQISFTEQQLIISNTNRLILYNYINDVQNKDQKYYLDMYNNNEVNNNIRYFQTLCSDTTGSCRCGQYVMSAQKPYKLVYLKSALINKIRHKVLMIYDWNIDKQHQFQTIIDQDPFVFTLSQDGKYLAFSINYGKNIKIYEMYGIKSKFKCTLYLGMTISPFANQGFFYAEGKLWYQCTRIKQNSIGSMHIYNVEKGTTVQKLESQYIRYLQLFQKTLKDYNICQTLIGPDYYVNNEILYVFSMNCVVYDVIDFKRSGHHPKRNAQNFSKWVQKQQIK